MIDINQRRLSMKIVYILLISLSLAIPCQAADEGGMSITPDSFWSGPGMEHELVVKGGLPPYRWQCKSGTITPIIENEGRYMYKAPKRYGDDWVRFEDTAGQHAEINIDIYRPLTISPSRMTLAPDQKGNVRVIGGSGQYEINKNEVLNTQMEKDGLITVSPKVEEGETVLTVKDGVTGETVSLPITIYGPIMIQKKTKT